MLHAIKRWIHGAAPPAANGWLQVEQWALARQWVFRGVRESDGFVIEGRTGVMPWRMEWGPAQRAYIDGFELRFRAELPVPGELQVLLLNRTLMEAMEKSVFDQYIEGVQTRIDTEIPPEMRWLVMFPKLSGAELKTLREGFAAVTNSKPWARHWLAKSLTPAVLGLQREAVLPLVLMVARSRLSIRTPLAQPDCTQLERWFGFFETALREARRVAVDESEGSGQTTQPSLWAPSAVPLKKPVGNAIR